MHSFRLSAAIAATILLDLAQAQYSIAPSSVPITTRQQWCQSQITSCPLLCLQLPGESSTTSANDCDSTSLAYNCVCGNGQSPNASEYSQTIPFYECQETGNQCVVACNGNPVCQTSCREDHPCGAQTPTRANSTSSSTSSSTTGSATGSDSSSSDGTVFKGLSGTSPTSQSPSEGGSQAALDLGRSYGLAVVFVGLFTVFGTVM